MAQLPKALGQPPDLPSEPQANILLVDDNPGNLLSLRAILEEVLMDVMFELPSREDVVEVKVTESCITLGTPPLLEISPKRQKKEA